MSVAGEAVERYLREKPMLEQFAKDVADRIRRVMIDGELDVTVSDRVKDVASFRGKIARKNYTDPWSQITDKAGVRVIAGCPREANAAVEAICQSADLVSSEPTYIFPELADPAEDGGSVEPTQLGYTGIHIQVRVPSGEYPAYESEVQVRTRAQDLWSVLSHEYLYKPVVHLAGAHKRALYRLSALTEIVDSEVDRAYESLAQDKAGELARSLERLWLRMGLPPGDGQLTRFVVSSLAGADDNAERLIELVRSHADEHAGEIRDMHARFGANDEGYLADNALFDQPELILVRVLLEKGRLALGEKWVEAELPPEWLEAVALRFGSGGLATQTRGF